MSRTLTSMCLWKWRRAKDVSLSLPIVDLRAVLMRLRPLKDRSAKQEVTGRVQSMSSKTLIFGNMAEACGRDMKGDVGKEACPCSSCCFHFMCQQ